jgi:hypothetical protein
MHSTENSCTQCQDDLVDHQDYQEAEADDKAKGATSSMGTQPLDTGGQGGGGA